MFESIIAKYDSLLEEFELLTTDEIVQRLFKLRMEYNGLQEKLDLQNGQRITKTINSRIVEYVRNAGEDENLFEQIDNIRINVQEEFKKECEYWKDILAQKEKQLTFKLKTLLSKEPFQLGTHQDNGVETKIRWTVFDAEPIQNKVKLIATDCIEPIVFDEQGYTDVEDRDSFGCAETLCSWSYSDVHDYLNGKFYDITFSDDEKVLIQKTHRQVNLKDPLIINDCSDDYIFLLTLDEFAHLDPTLKKCTGIVDIKHWWLCEQAKCGWDDEDFSPEIYVVKCDTGEQEGLWADDQALLRPAMTLNLDDFVNQLDKKIND